MLSVDEEEEESRAWVEVEGKDNSNSNFQSHPIHHLSIHQFDGVAQLLLPGWLCLVAFLIGVVVVSLIHQSINSRRTNNEIEFN